MRKYSIIGRYMEGNSVTGYRVVANDGSGERDFIREQIIFLLGKGGYN